MHINDAPTFNQHPQGGDFALVVMSSATMWNVCTFFTKGKIYSWTLYFAKCYDMK